MSLIREFTAFELRPFQGGVRVLNPDGTPQALPGTYEIGLFRHGATAAFVTGSVAGGELTVNAGAGTIDFSFAAAAMTSVVGYGAAEIRDMAAGGRVLSVIPVRFLPQATPWQPEYNERLVLHSNTSVVVVEPLAAAGGAVVAEGSYGDVGVTGSGLIWTIANDAVGNSKLANMAAGTIKANITGAAADPADVSRAALVPWLALQATEIVVTPSGGIASATVAAALTELDTEKLDKAGGTISGNLIITGSLIHNGATYQVNATMVTYDDIILVIGGDTAPVVDDGRDRGVAFRWHDGATAKLGFFGFDRSAQEFTFIPDATDTADVISGTAGTLRANLNGNAATASAWATGRNISLTGMVTGVSGAFDGSGNLSFATALGSFTLAQLNAAVSDADLSAATHTHLLAAGATDVTVSAANLNALDDGVNTALHFHDSDRARANHTGTQVADTISDFAATVLSSVLTGFAVAGARTAIVAADTVLAAFGKVQKYLNDLSALAFSGSAADLTGTKTSAFISDFTEAAQDAVGAGLDATLAYNDAGNSMGRAAISGHIVIAAGSNSAALGSFTLAQLNAAVSDADIPSTSHTHSGLLPAGGGTGQVIKKLSATDYDYAWAAEAGGGGSGLSDGDYGDMIISAGATVFTIDAGVVTYAKLQDMAANTVLARAANTTGDASEVALAASTLLGRGSSGDVAAITLGDGLAMAGTVLSAQGAVKTVTRQEFTASGNYVKPANLLFAVVELQGPGGGGGGSSGSNSNTGVAVSGSAGGYCRKTYLNANLASSEAFTLGLPGTGGAAGNNNGTAGGSCTFKGLTANGGAAGNAGSPSTVALPYAGVDGGTASGGDVNIQGGASTWGFRLSGTSAVVGQGGTSVLGTPSVSVGGSVAGTSGSGYGQGGRGAVTNTSIARAGANGGGAILIVTEYCS